MLCKLQSLNLIRIAYIEINDEASNEALEVESTFGYNRIQFVDLENFYGIFFNFHVPKQLFDKKLASFSKGHASTYKILISQIASLLTDWTDYYFHNLRTIRNFERLPGPGF